jgi:hypothetical protein
MARKELLDEVPEARRMVELHQVRDLVRHDVVGEIDVPAIDPWIQEREPFHVVNRVAVGVHAPARPGMLDQPDLAKRVRTEPLRVVSQRGLRALHHALQMLRVSRVMEDLDRDRPT